MSKLFEKSKHILEFDKIIEQLKNFAVSEMAKELIDETDISLDIDEIRRRQLETSEAVNLIVKKGEPPLFGLYEMNDYMKRVKIGGALSPGALLRVSDFLRVSRYLKNYIKNDEANIDFPIISAQIENLSVYRNIEDKINMAIISENEISDNASSKLSSIRKQIQKKKESVRDKLNQIVTSDKDMLQDSIVTIREGRYVVPVKQENKSKVKGLVHDVSSSGQTFYIEPMAVVNLNNDLRELAAEEREEIERILHELSDMVADVSYEILANEGILKQCDFIFAKGKMSMHQNSYSPKLNKKGYTDLKEARHPLLDQSKIVPIDIYLGKDFTSLIITGPNTGGKTVTLKTIGLLTLMAQYGLHIPAKESSEIGIVKNVFADIGDEQSIEQSLSTFSAHMVNIVEIIKEADKDSLVLFDELGAGTDPTEGAALARSIMDYMLERNIRTVATTHYTQLKIYALTVPGVKNASMEFNVDSLSPTYKLLIGVPGKSNAFEISQRLGLSNEIIDYARELISDDNIEFEAVLQSIEEDRTKIEMNRDEAEREKRQLEEKNEELQKEIDKVKSQRDRIIKDAKLEAKRILNSTREDVSLILSEIQDLKSEMSSSQARRLQQAQDVLREDLQMVSFDNEKIKLKTVKNPVKKLKIGDSVRVISLNAEGTVVELPDENNNVMVQVGMMKMKLPKDTLVKSDTVEEKTKQRTKKIIETKSKTIKSEIDVRGMIFDDAKYKVDKYLDDAFLSGLKSVRIIHGKGSGALRSKIKDHLRHNKNIKTAKDAAYNEGGDGVTIVVFR